MLSVPGILASDNPIIDLVADGTSLDTAKAQIEDYCKIFKITTKDGGIVVYATGLTSVELPILIRVDR